jgi:hypothetical protein
METGSQATGTLALTFPLETLFPELPHFFSSILRGLPDTFQAALVMAPNRDRCCSMEASSGLVFKGGVGMQLEVGLS